MPFARRNDAREPKPLTAEALEAAALRYLDRFDCSERKLRSHLATLIRKRGGDASLSRHVDALLARYRASGLLNDERFAKNLAERMQARGVSRRMVEHESVRMPAVRESQRSAGRVHDSVERGDEHLRGRKFLADGHE